MANSVQKVNKKRVIMALLSLVLINTGCEDRIDSSGVSGEKMVEVSLNIGIADEADGYDLSVAPASKAGSPKNSAFDMQLVPKAATRAVSSKPDKLYKLEIRQYNQTGTSYLGGIEPTDKAIGETFTASLKEATNCQLVFVAWGQNVYKRLGSGSLASAQAITVDASVIKGIQPGNMNTMPYVLHLKNVNVTSDGKITSPEGKDVRVLLKRLAARLTLTWNYNVSGYKLNQILLQSIPLDYKVVAAPDEKENNTYPSLLDQYTTIQLTESEIESGSYSCWIPANVRGTNSFASSPLYRIKSNAPTGSVYASFIAVNNDDYKKKLDYRVYLGGNDYSDFSLYSNTDYSYTVKFNHTGLPVNDRRVTIIDPIRASESNNNILPTANCFMIAPGGAFCFDPFVFQQNGMSIDNSTLKEWSDNEEGIAYVKLIWQTKENGDVGDPVMGVVNSADDHTNIVDIKKNNGGEVSKESTVTAKDQARIYCRVAPNTTGGSGLIAAYNKSNDIIWSWHVWVTDYSPSLTETETVLTPVNKRQLKFTYNNSNQPPMMDRNLGAMAGFTWSDRPKNPLDMSKANGLHYQWGRKDPFAGSYSSTSVQKVTGLNSASIAPKNMLNRYGPDGISYLPLKTITSRQTLRNAYKTPSDYIMLEDKKAAFGWCDDGVSVIQTLWNDANGLKGLNDPCPAGWRIVSVDHLKALTTSSSIVGSSTATPNAANKNSAVEDGGIYLYFQGAGSGEASYFRFPGYRRTVNSFEFIGTRSVIWMREYSAEGVDRYYFSGFDIIYEYNRLAYFGVRPEAFSNQDGQVTRCIQEK